MTRRVRSGTMVAALVVSGAALVAAYLGKTASGGLRSVAAVAVFMVVGVFLLTGGRQAILGLTVLGLIVGSSAAGALKSAIFYGRFALLGALIVANVLTGKRSHASARERAFIGAISGFAALAVCSAIWSVDPNLTIQRAMGMSLLFGSIATSALYVWNDGAAVERDFRTIAAVFLAAIFVGIPAYLVHASWAFSGSRFRGVLENPNTIGIVCSMVLPVVVALAADANTTRRGSWILGAMLLTFSVLAAASRGGIVGSALGIGVLLLRRAKDSPRRTIPLLVVLGVVAGSLFLITASGSGSDQSPVSQAIARFTTQDDSGRSDGRRIALDASAERPVTGWGFGTQEKVIAPRVPVGGALTGLVHNGYLVVLVEMGPLGLLLILVALGLALRSVWRVSDPRMLVALAAFVAGSFSQIIESGLTSAGAVFTLTYWMIAMAAIRLRALADAGVGVRAPDAPVRARTLSAHVRV